MKKGLAILLGLAFSFPSFATSVYQLPGQWRDQSDQQLTLNQFNGHWMIASLAYTDCKSICPMTVQNMKSVEQKLGAASDKVDFVLFSIDPSQDTPEVRRNFLKSQKVTGAHWHFLTGDLKNARAVSASMGMGFGDKSAGGAHIMHTFKIALISPTGSVVETGDAMKIDEISKKTLAAISAQ